MTHVAQRAAAYNMHMFINRDPTTILVQSRKTALTASGGRKFVLDGDPFNETVRMIPATTTTEKQSVRITADGRTVTARWMVAAMTDSEIKVGDYFTADGIRYEVIHRAPVPSWRVTFEAIEDGQ
jgi:hypothetical protein